MKKIVILLGVSILMLSFGDSSQNSFSQKVTRNPPVPTQNSVPVEQVKEEQFVKDTSYLNRLILQAIDSLKMENEKTNARVVVKKETVKVQKMNERDLSQISQLLNRGLEKVSQGVQTMPTISVIEKKSEPKPLDVNISAPNPDTLIVPIHRKGFFEFFKFWR